jgi:predicted DNA-binding mobile mystery protein A
MQTTKRKTSQLRRKQLDVLYRTLLPAVRDVPNGAWIRDVRQALGMSAVQMAKMLGVTPPTLKKLEHNEATRSITLKTLHKVADVLGCRLVYAFVPEPGIASLDAILKQRALLVATRIVDKVSHTMSLENQSVSAHDRASQIEELASELIQTMDKRLWE